MGCLSVLVCAVPIYFIYNTGQPVLWIATLVNAIANLWSFGVMHNYAVGGSAEKIKRLRDNMTLEGRLDDEAQQRIDKIGLEKDLRAVPNWLSTINLITAIVGFCFLIYGVWAVL